MNSVDALYIIQWYSLLLLIGTLVFPLTSLLFEKFVDKGYIFSKVISMVVLSYVTFLLSMIHIIQFTHLSTSVMLVVLSIISNWIFFSKKNAWVHFKAFLKTKWILLLLEELLFFAALYFWSVVRGYAPDIHGLEKFMDFGFVNSILRSSYFPPNDMWFTPFSINYYYFGHLITAVLIKLSGISPAAGYNLMIATLFAYTFTCAFSLGANFYALFRTQTDALLQPLAQKKSHGHTKPEKCMSLLAVICAGLLAAFLVACAGNIHTIYAFFAQYSTEKPQPIWQMAFSPQTFPNAYWYPNATRFIFNTIHEFPLYSFVVSDLHGHVLSIPIVLTIIALVFHEFLSRKMRIIPLIFLSFLIACAYMTNAWDGIIYFLLTFVLIFSSFAHLLNFGSVHNFRTFIAHIFQKAFLLNMTFYTLLVIVGFLLFSFPFSLHFKPFVSGIGVLCAPSFLTNIGKVGPFLFEAQHCQKSPIWQLLILYGFFYFWVFSFFVHLYRKKPYVPTDSFILILILLSTFLIVIPEFIYAKDIYPAHYRANTMFKLVYQTFMMLGLCASYIIMQVIPAIKNYILSPGKALGRLSALVYLIIAAGLLYFVSIYPYFAINSYYGDLKTYHGLNGLTYLSSSYPGDYQAIQWINSHIKGQPVILEAQGDSYTDFARVSAFTGLPTLLGWTVHEWLWRGTYDIPAPRIEEVKTLYETSDLTVAKQLIKKYNVRLIYVGALEHQKYPTLSGEKFKKLGTVVYKNSTTTIYQL